MAIPRSPAFGHNTPNPHDDPEDLDDPAGLRTPDPGRGNGSRQATPPPPPETPEAELARIRQELQQARERIAILQRTSSVTPAPKTLREPRVNKPAEFSGKLSEYSTFISQCLLIFSMCPISYARAEQKVLFVISYLAGTARGWARAILEDPNHPYRNNFDEFKKALDAMYADRNLKQRARDKLGHLEQTKSVASYSADFQNIIAPLNLDDGSKQSMFYKGLDSEIKKALIFFPAAKNFDELLEQCVSIDQRQYALRQEEKHAGKSSKHSKSPGNNSNANNFKKSGQSSSHNSGSTPEQKQSGHSDSPRRPHGLVSKDEKNHRRENNLCFRCGSPKHRIVDCPLDKGRVPNHPAKASNAQPPEYSSSPAPSENWLSQGTLRQAP